MRELCDWLGLEYEPALLEIPVVNSSYATTGAGVSSEPVERWRERLSPAEVGSCSRSASRCSPQLGYTPDDVTVSPVRLAWAWATVPFAAARAAVVNRQRLGKATQYLRTRAKDGVLARAALAARPSA